ncbi:flagellin N-terminal helical domain-containing protein [Peptoanaerobacter stomatis]|uniref:flagellin N-terminal helical domain-containing protein n=1 Tax=Peptoanaerobacter stomatis TaxID=796937 RepID=UPI003F9FABC0
MIRITQSMQIARTLLDQNLNLQRMNDYSNDMSSRTNLHRPSDDPLRVARAMRLMTELRVNETYKQDLQAAHSWTSKTDVTLNTLSDIIKRVRELTVQAASGEKTQEDKQKIMQEIKQLKKAATELANDDYMGRYQFSGYKTNKKFVNEDGSYNQDLDLAGLKYEKINYNIGVGQKTDINFTGVEVFGNEHFTTKTRAKKAVPFTDEPQSVLGAKMNVKLQKYKKSDAYYEKNKTNLNTPSGAADEDKKNNEIEEKYEKETKLGVTDGGEIDLGEVSFYGSYKKGDVNAIVEDLNKSLRAQIAKKAKEKYPSDPDKEEKFRKELEQSVQFVNDDGKISMVTDRDYAGKIQAGKLTLKEIQKTKETSVQPSINKNTELGVTSGPLNYSGNTVRAHFNFDMELTEYNKDSNGDIINTSPKTPKIELKNISLSKEYDKTGKSDEEVAKLIAADLQTQINAQLMKHGLPEDTVRVTVDPATKQPRLAVNREYGVKLTNTTGATNITAASPATQTYTPNVNSASNPVTNETDFNVTTPTAGADSLVNFDFNLKLTQYHRYGQSGGDVLISNPGVNPATPPTPGTPGHLAFSDPNYPPQPFDLGKISLVKKYSGKNDDGSNKNPDDILREIAKDLQETISEKAASHKPPLDASKIKVEVKNGKIMLMTDGNMKMEITNTAGTLTQTKFDDTMKTPVPDGKNSMDIDIPAPNPMPPGTISPLERSKYDTHVYMNLKMNVQRYKKDENGNATTNKILPNIEINDLTINKTYKREKPDGSGTYTDDEIQKQIADDIKAKIEEKLSQINPPLDKKMINISYDSATKKVKVSVNQDVSVTVETDNNKPSSINSDVEYMPDKAVYEEPTREKMPFFEMMDRLMKFMDEGNSKGLSRMLDVIDYHAKNTQKIQGIGGGRTNMYNLMMERTEDIKLNYSELLSDTRDTDYNETSMKMMVAQYVYRASLSVTAKIIQPSLVDFLR